MHRHTPGRRVLAPLLALLAVLALLALPLAGFAQSEESAALEQRVEEFFETLRDEPATPGPAFDNLLVDSPLEEPERVADVERLIEQVVEFNGLYGRFLDYERVGDWSFGRSHDVVVLRYLYKAERFPLVWNFVFYRPPSSVATAARNYVVVAITIDTQLDALIHPPRDPSR